MDKNDRDSPPDFDVCHGEAESLGLSDACIDALYGLLNFTPAERIPMEQLLNGPWLAQIVY